MVIDLQQAASDFIAEIAGAQERKKKTLFDTPYLQGFMLYIKAHGHVPSHEAKGEITVQTVTGRIRMGIDGSQYSMPAGALLPIEANVPHELWADEESVCFVTMEKH
jgi:quercetin dioxygenase-like cupin family protein